MLFSKVLVAYDGSNLSKKALEKALGLMQGGSNSSASAKLIVMHVMHTPTYSYAASAAPYYFNMKNIENDTTVLSDVKMLIPASLDVTYEAIRGQPAHAILDYAQQNNCDLIVMGSRGLGAIREFFLGSVSHNVVQNSKIPVLIVK
jgi:nucleotide-binding universal stress UspA family protein